jgi:hypothetical protein
LSVAQASPTSSHRNTGRWHQLAGPLAPAPPGQSASPPGRSMTAIVVEPELIRDQRPRALGDPGVDTASHHMSPWFTSVTARCTPQWLGGGEGAGGRRKPATWWPRALGREQRVPGACALGRHSGRCSGCDHGRSQSQGAAMWRTRSARGQRGPARLVTVCGRPSATVPRRGTMVAPAQATTSASLASGQRESGPGPAHRCGMRSSGKVMATRTRRSGIVIGPSTSWRRGVGGETSTCDILQPCHLRSNRGERPVDSRVIWRWRHRDATVRLG